MLIGCCTKLEYYDQVVAAGFDFIELAGKVIAALPENAFDSLLKHILTSPLPCPALNAYCSSEIVIAGPGADRDKAKDYAKFLAPRAHALGVKVVNIGSPYSRILPEGFDYHIAMDQAQAFFQDTAQEFNPYGIQVTVEALSPSFCNFINTLDEAMALVNRLADSENLGIVLDFYNMRGSGEPDTDLNSLAPYILHVHDSDDAGDPYLRSFYHPEHRSTHFRNLQKLKKIGYDNRISIETDIPFDLEAARYSIDVIRTGWNANENEIAHLVNTNRQQTK